MHDLTVIIVSWNCREDLAACLASLPGANTATSVQIVVVDNASGDGTVAMVEASFPHVRLVKNAENVGFAAANNQALKMSRSRYLLLLNPDTIVHPGAFDVLVRFMDHHPDAWCAGPALANTNGTLQRTGVRFPSLWNIFCESLLLDRMFPMGRLFGAHRELYTDPSKLRKVDYVQGAALLVRQEVIERIGGLDENFFMYFEEADWCYRMRESGGSVFYVPEATVVHLGGETFGHYDERRLVWYHQSLFLFYRKHYDRHARFLLRPLIIFRSLIRVIVWTGVFLGRPVYRAASRSSLKGYVRVLGLACGKETA